MIPWRRGCVLIAAAAVVVGCGSDGDWPASRARPTAVGRLGPGFVDAEAPPAPEATIRPRPGSWDRVRPPKGYRVVLLRAGGDRQTDTLAAAVTTWSAQVHASLKTITGSDPRRLTTDIGDAIDLHPDLVVSVGNLLVDPLAVVTANHLSQQFLVLGAQVAEPTGNVTAADWIGASFRGEGLGLPDRYDAASFTPQRAGRALRAGVAAVLNGITGVVVRVS